jgi:hypothetical protein
MRAFFRSQLCLFALHQHHDAVRYLAPVRGLESAAVAHFPEILVHPTHLACSVRVVADPKFAKMNYPDWHEKQTRHREPHPSFDNQRKEYVKKKVLLVDVYGSRRPRFATTPAGAGIHAVVSKRM